MTFAPVRRRNRAHLHMTAQRPYNYHQVPHHLPVSIVESAVRLMVLLFGKDSQLFGYIFLQKLRNVQSLRAFCLRPDDPTEPYQPKNMVLVGYRLQPTYKNSCREL